VYDSKDEANSGEVSIRALKLFASIIEKLDEDDLMFNNFSLADSEIRKNWDSKNVFYFHLGVNNHKKTKQDLQLILPRYIITTFTSEEHINHTKIAALMTNNNTIILNMAYSKHLKEQQQVVFQLLNLIHEASHLKRYNYGANGCRELKSPIIKFPFQNEEDRDEIGFLIEYLTCVYNFYTRVICLKGLLLN
jgi:hypothetical protein